MASKVAHVLQQEVINTFFLYDIFMCLGNCKIAFSDFKVQTFPKKCLELLVLFAAW